MLKYGTSTQRVRPILQNRESKMTLVKKIHIYTNKKTSIGISSNVKVTNMTLHMHKVIPIDS